MIKLKQNKGTLRGLVKSLIRFWNTKKLLRDIRQSEKEFAQGKGKVLRSLKDLR